MVYLTPSPLGNQSPRLDSPPSLILLQPAPILSARGPRTASGSRRVRSPRCYGELPDLGRLHLDLTWIQGVAPLHSPCDTSRWRRAYKLEEFASWRKGQGFTKGQLRDSDDEGGGTVAR